MTLLLCRSDYKDCYLTSCFHHLDISQPSTLLVHLGSVMSIKILKLFFDVLIYSCLVDKSTVTI